MRWKYHPESGAFEHIPSADTLELISLKKENKSLSEENAELKDKMDNLLNLLKQKKLITVKEAKDL